MNFRHQWPLFGVLGWGMITTRRAFPKDIKEMGTPFLV